MLVLTTAGLWQWSAKFMFYILEAESSLAIPGPQLLSDLRHWLDVQLIAELFFYTTLVFVKLSFLFFFRRLGQNVQGQKYIWWPVLVFSLIVYVISIGNVQYKCYSRDLEVVLTYCTSEEANNFTMATLRANMAIDVFSDFLIIAIPIPMLWNVRVPGKKKLAFVGLFSLSIITMVVAIVRAVSVNSSRDGSGQDNATFLWLWTAIQASLAVIIACLSAFPQLFVTSAAKKKPVWTPTDTYYKRITSRMKTNSNNNNMSYSLSSISPSGDFEAERPFSNDSSGLPRSGRDNNAMSYDSRRLWLVPSAALQKPAVVYYGEYPHQNKAAQQKKQNQQNTE
jgi:hypothetical protein